MKLCLAVLALAAPAAALLRGDIDVDAVQTQLSDMLGEANNRLARAEAHHQKVVDKARSDIAEDFDTQSGKLGTAVLKYEASLINVETQLQASINASKAGLTQAAKAPGADDWNSPAFSEKAKLGAQVNAAERNLRRMLRQRSNNVKNAESHAEEPFEDETQRLGLVVGDLSKDMGDAKERIEDTVDLSEMSGNMTRDALSAVKASVVLPMPKTAKEEEDRLLTLEKNLDAAVKSSKAAAMEAQTALGEVLKKETDEQKGKSDDVLNAIHAAEKEERTSVTAGQEKHVEALKKAKRGKLVGKLMPLKGAGKASHKRALTKAKAAPKKA